MFVMLKATDCKKDEVIVIFNSRIDILIEANIVATAYVVKLCVMGTLTYDLQSNVLLVNYMDSSSNFDTRYVFNKV